MTASDHPGTAGGFLLIAVPALMLIQTGIRFVFWWQFRESTTAVDTGTLLGAFVLGARFDLRLTLLLLAPMLVASLLPAMNPERSPWARRFWCGHLALVTTILLLVQVSDLAHYGYLGEHLNASSLRFFLNPVISTQMLLESYPIFWGGLGLAAFAVVMLLLFRFTMSRSYAIEIPTPTFLGNLLVTTVTVAIFAAGIYGKFSWYPLRWSDAYATPRRFASDVALNPMLFFIGSLGVAETRKYDEAAVRAAYGRVSKYLNVETPDPEGLTFKRQIRPAALSGSRPNVVIVLLESFSAHKTGAFGNPLDASPRFDEIARDSLLYTNFYTPRRGTARGVFATMTGIPDTMTNRTASRNPQAVRQQIMVNQFEGYDRFYFLGGSANWANIRGLLGHNISDLQIYEEGSFDSDRTDVWGISDLHLFEEANRILSASERPFFALIHCSGNHRPYTIPEDNRGFVLRQVDHDTLMESGFESEVEFNSFRFLDHAIGFLIDEARDEAYFQNTVFLFFGDNGTGGRAPHMYSGEEALGLSEHHTPLAIYAPGLIPEGRRIGLLASQVDVMATIASITGMPVTNTTLGRNLFDTRLAGARYALIQPKTGLVPEIGLLDEEYLMLVNVDGSVPRLFAYRSETPAQDIGGDHPERLQEMSEIGRDLYHTSKWMLYHNARDGQSAGGAP